MVFEWLFIQDSYQAPDTGALLSNCGQSRLGGDLCLERGYGGVGSF